MGEPGAPFYPGPRVIRQYGWRNSSSPIHPLGGPPMLVIIDRDKTKWGQRDINLYRLIFTMSMAIIRYKVNGLRDDFLHGNIRDRKKRKKGKGPHRSKTKTKTCSLVGSSQGQAWECSTAPSRADPSGTLGEAHGPCVPLLPIFGPRRVNFRQDIERVSLDIRT